VTTAADHHNGPCVVCMTPTDTALAFEGCAEWCMAGLSVLGVPLDEAIAIFNIDPDEPDANGRHTVRVRVCVGCVRKCSAPFPDPTITLPGGGIPVVPQP
jgi:hypothetical protein